MLNQSLQKSNAVPMSITARRSFHSLSRAHYCIRREEDSGWHKRGQLEVYRMKPTVNQWPRQRGFTPLMNYPSHSVHPLTVAPCHVNSVAEIGAPRSIAMCSKANYGRQILDLGLITPASVKQRYHVVMIG
jgi:hypothetical protein